MAKPSDRRTGIVRMIAVFGLAAAVGVGAGCRPAAPILRPPETGTLEASFPGYMPKTTPDTLSDYRPQLADRLARLPPAALDSLPALVAELDRMEGLGLKKPGRWEQGSIPLGGDPMEYVPSDEELLVSELGDRIGQVVARENAGVVRKTLDSAGVKSDVVVYQRIVFRHVDVMGSGRYFYASVPLQVVIPLKYP